MAKVIKNVVLVCLIIFVISYIVIYFLGNNQPNQSLSSQANSSAPTSQANPNSSTPSAQNSGSTAAPATKSYTSGEVAGHNSANDCWSIINNKVYNLTDYLYQHPGSASAILPYCGADGTKGYDTKDQRRASPHSGFADSLLQAYYLGNLK